MEIGATDPVASVQRQQTNQPAESPSAASDQENGGSSAATSTSSAPAANDLNPTQRVQPTGESEPGQATTNNNPPEPDPNSQEGVGRFIDTVV